MFPEHNGHNYFNSDKYSFRKITRDLSENKADGRCTYCGVHENDLEDVGNGKLQLHHIVPKAWARKYLLDLPEVRHFITSLENGDYVCKSCHDNTHLLEGGVDGDAYYQLLVLNALGPTVFRDKTHLPTNYLGQKDWRETPIETEAQDIKKLEEKELPVVAESPYLDLSLVYYNRKKAPADR